MHTHTRAILPVLTTGLAALALHAAPAHAVPERFHDAGTIVWCEGEEAGLTAIDTAQGGTSVSAGLLLDDGRFAIAGGEQNVLTEGGLGGTLAAEDAETGAPLGDLVLAGAITRGATETVSGWDVDEDGRRNRTEGTRTPLSGTATLSLAGTTTELSCSGWEIDLQTFRLTLSPAAGTSGGWWPEPAEIGEGVQVGFYGDRETELGIALDLAAPSAFAGERLQVRNGVVEGDLLLRDPETWAVTGLAHVRGTVTHTGTERIEETAPGYRRVTELAHYTVALTVRTAEGEYDAVLPAVHETTRDVSVQPPAA